jgi:hypothetical protein
MVGEERGETCYKPKTPRAESHVRPARPNVKLRLGLRLSRWLSLLFKAKSKVRPQAKYKATMCYVFGTDEKSSPPQTFSLVYSSTSSPEKIKHVTVTVS